MALDVRLLPLDQFDAAADLLTRAFAADPILTALIAEQERPTAFPAFFRHLMFSCWESGTVYAADDGGVLAGVSIWEPPSRVTPSEEFASRAEAELQRVREASPAGFARLMDGFSAVSALHPAEPHWYLAFIGVEPARQGTGAGRALLAPALEAADRDGVLCYLETPFPETHDFYRRFGYVLHPPTHPFAEAPPLWTMTRQPRPLVGS